MNKTIQAIEEIEGMVKTLNLDNQTGRLNISMLAMDKFNEVMMKDIEIIKSENKEAEK